MRTREFPAEIMCRSGANTAMETPPGISLAIIADLHGLAAIHLCDGRPERHWLQHISKHLR